MGREVRDRRSSAGNRVKLAITGATGFLGRHVLAELAQRSISPVVVCRPQTAPPAHIANYVIASFDLHDPPADAFDRMGRPDVLIHLAWGGLPNYRSLVHFEHELPAQYRFLKGIIEAGLKSVAVTGTCFEYGMQSGALSEDMQTRPANPYGFAKDVLRRELQFLKQVHAFNLTWARLFYMYGEGQSRTSLLAQLRAAVERGDTVFNMSGGEQLRDYLPATQVAKDLVALAVTGLDNGVVNVCSGVPVSVRKLVEGWLEQNGWAIKLNLGHYPYPDYEPMAFWGDRRRFAALCS
jgi:dTDP-6-deoxy-L-talose 4-dehydrogenase (NAD+)